jgi:hypothetical protein
MGVRFIAAMAEMKKYMFSYWWNTIMIRSSSD